MDLAALRTQQQQLAASVERADRLDRDRRRDRRRGRRV